MSKASEEIYQIDIYRQNDVGAEVRADRKQWSYTKDPVGTVRIRFQSIRKEAYEVHVPSAYLRGLHRSLLDPELKLYNLIDFVDNSIDYTEKPSYSGKLLLIPTIFEFSVGEFLFSHNGSSYRFRFYSVQDRKRGNVVRKAYRRAAERPDPKLPAGHDVNRTTKRISMQLDYDVLALLDETQKVTGFDRTRIISSCAILGFASGVDAEGNRKSLSGHTKLVQFRVEPDIAAKLKSVAESSKLSMTDWVAASIMRYAKRLSAQDVALTMPSATYDQ